MISLITLAIGLTAYSWVVGFINLSKLSAHINQDLMQRARMLARQGPPRRGPNGEFMLPRGNGPGDRQPMLQGDPDGPPLRRDGPDDGNPRRGPDDMFLGNREPGENPDLRRARFTGSIVRKRGDDSTGPPFDQSLFSDSARGKEGFADLEIQGQLVRVFSTPWRNRFGEDGAVQVARDLRDYDDLRRTQIWTWLTLAPVALLLSAFGAYVLAGRAVKPLKAMESAATKMGQGDLSQRLEVQGDDELASLANTLNTMAGNLEKSFQDKQSAYDALKESYESQRRFTADASHELRTPLARLQLATSSALRGPESGYKEALETADTSAKSMAKLIRELLVLARADAGQLGLRHDLIDLRLAVSNALNGISREVAASFPNSPVTIEGDQDHLERVVTNLIENAVRHTPGDKPISVSLSTRDGQAVIAVEDAGEGIAAADLPHLFERFYRADSARPEGGIGLGLAICKSVVEGHGGTITVQSEVGEGTRVEVKLPLDHKS